MSAWISVQERLPAKDVEVLIAFEGHDTLATGHYTGLAHHYEGWNYPFENVMADCGAVTHWQPLPPHPSAKGGAA